MMTNLDKIGSFFTSSRPLFHKMALGAVLTALFLAPVLSSARLAAQIGPGEPETPVAAARKNRPPAPTGNVAENHYPDGFLSLSSETTPVPKGGKMFSNRDSVQEPFRKDHLIFLLGAAVAVGLFLVVAWTDHLYRVRLQSIIAQNNRLLNGEDIDQFADVPSVGIPLFLGTNQALVEELSPALSECLSEPLTEEIAKRGK